MTASKSRNWINFIPMLLVVIMVALLLAPAVKTVIENAARSSTGVSEEGEETSAASDGDYFLTWEEYIAGHGITEWNWNDAADAIERVAFHAADLYEAGDMDNAYAFAKATYWGYYETTGFERNTMTYISGSRVSACELQFTTLRKAVKKDLGLEQVREEAQKLSDMLHEDALVLSPEGSIASTDSSAADTEGAGAPAETSISAGSAAATFVGSFGIILREGLEAILVVGAIIAYLIKSGNKKGIVPVYVGSVLGIVCSFIMAGILAWLKSINPETTMTQEIIEGFAALIAVVVLFYVSNWMVSKSEAAAWEGYIQGKVEGSAQQGNMFALGFTAWLAVFREGAEVILFYQPMLGEGHANMVWAGFGVGCAVLVVVFLLIRFLSIKLPIKPFFLATSILMALMTICFLGSGIKELMEGGVFDDFEFMLTKPSWLLWIPDAASGTGGTAAEICNTLGFYPYLGTFVPQLILLVITVVTFVVVMKKNKQIRLEKEAAAQQ